MAAILYANLVKVNNTTSGTGTLTLGTTVTGFRGVAALTNAGTYQYSILGAGGVYENGLGVYTASGTTFTRATVYDSSNSDALVSLAGTETVIIGIPLSQSVTPPGSDTNILFNDGGNINAVAAFSFSKANNELIIGSTPGFNFVNAQFMSIGSINNYSQVIIQNINTGNNASSDLVCQADGSNDTIGFVNLGINNKLYLQTGTFDIAGAGDAYLYTLASNSTVGGNLSIGTGNANPLKFFTGGVLVANERMRIDSGGNVAIATTTTTAAKFTVSGTASLGNTTITGFANATVSVNSALLTVGTIFIANTTQVTITTPLSANGGVGAAGNVLTSNGATGSPYWVAPSSVVLNANNTDAVTYYFPMSNTGVNGTTWSNGVMATTQMYFVPSTGTLSATIFSSLSDINYKTNIVTIHDAIDTIKQLNGVSFNWKDNGQKSYGIIAQEIEQILPELVNNGDNKKSVNYAGLIGFLVNAIKELNSRVEYLETN